MAERRLPVRSDSEEPPPRLARKRPAAQEPGDRVAAAVPRRDRGMAIVASSVSIATTASTSARSQAST
jgi:hypothetical protein